MLGDQLYTGWSNGSLTRRTFSGSSYGSPTTIDTADEIVADAAWHADVAAATGMFFADGRIYYTRAGSNALYFRYYTTESEVVGAERFTASSGISGVDFSQVAGMFVAGGKLYWGSSADGNLRKVTFTAGKPSGTPSVVSGPGVDDKDWKSRATFLFAHDVAAANEAPAAVVADNCDGLTCAFSSIGSHDSDGGLESYAWSFGDGSTGTGSSPSHTYAEEGTYTVELTVTDDDRRDQQCRDDRDGPRAERRYLRPRSASPVTVWPAPSTVAARTTTAASRRTRGTSVTGPPAPARRPHTRSLPAAAGRSSSP